LHTGYSHITRKGPVLSANPEEAVGVLSQALSDLSQEIATALQDVSTSSTVPRSEAK
jgi:hypothetical protein